MTHRSSKNAVSTEIDYASIARIASAVELRDIALRSSRATLHVDASEIPERWSGDAFVGFDSTVVEDQADREDFTINAAFIAVYKSSWSEQIPKDLPELDPNDPPEIEVQAKFELTYRANGNVAELSAEDLKNFAVANGTLHAWPYWREFADDMTRRMHVPRLVVGVFKIPSRHDPGGRPEASSAESTSEEEDSDAEQ